MAKRMLITGGAGFIGINSARHFIKKGWDVTIFDNFSRKGTELNIAELEKDLPGKFTVVKGDIRYDQKLMLEEVEKADVVLHLAAQVAVTTSVIDPRTDFEVNALGTFNVLEAVRLSKKRPFVIYTSTNKVFGALEEHGVQELEKRYRFEDDQLHLFGVPEKQNLDFHSPYGVSKGVADQYTIDYSRIYGLKTVVFRQSCIYGVHQFGVEDQGWLAWFTIAAMMERPITIYGTGKQVRDALFVEDLVRLYELAIDNQDIVNGKAYNIGGGPENTISLKEFFEHMSDQMGYNPTLRPGDVRPGDQPIFVADVRLAKKDLGWAPTIGVHDGLSDMHDWLKLNKTNVLKVFNS
jgi:CDP-paratose 2-epimerase